MEEKSYMLVSLPLSFTLHWWPLAFLIFSSQLQIKNVILFFHQKSLSFVVYLVRILAHLFFTAAHFHLALVAASISYFLTAATKLSCCSLSCLVTKTCLLCCLSLALYLCRPFSRWASVACRLLSLFLCLSLALFSNFLGMTIQLIQAFKFRLIVMSKNFEKYYNTSDNTDTETISAFRFRLYWLFGCLCFTRLGWLCDFLPK